MLGVTGQTLVIKTYIDSEVILLKNVFMPLTCQPAHACRDSEFSLLKNLFIFFLFALFISFTILLCAPISTSIICIATCYSSSIAEMILSSKTWWLSYKKSIMDSSITSRDEATLEYVDIIKE